MKTFVACIISLLVGLAIGCCIGYRYYERYITSVADKDLSAAIEGSSGIEAIIDVRAIKLIESGETTKAVQKLTRPIADFYYLYAIRGDTDSRREGRAFIEQFVSTNKIVAAEMTNLMVKLNYPKYEKTR